MTTTAAEGTAPDGRRYLQPETRARRIATIVADAAVGSRGPFDRTRRTPEPPGGTSGGAFGGPRARIRP